MSRLVTSGDTLNNFGKYLPTPYIEQIRVYNADADGRPAIEVEIYIYLRVTDETDVDSLVDNMEDVPILVGWFNNYETDVMEEVLNGTTKLIAGEVGDNWTVAPQPDILTDESQLNAYYLSDFEKVDDIEYDNAGNKLVKYYMTKTFEYTDDTATWDDITRSSLFTWSQLTSGLESYATTSDDGGFSGYEDPYGALMTAEMSSVAYEVIMQDGSITAQEEAIWTDTDDGVYNATALQSLSSQYYKADKITHSQIVDSFQSLVDDYEGQAATDAALQSMLDQISYVLVTYAEAADLLPQLNLLRRVFPSKSSTTTIGELYLKYREKIYTANAVVETDAQLSKRLVSNSKLVNETLIGLGTGYTAPDTPTTRGEAKILLSRILYQVETAATVDATAAYEYLVAVAVAESAGESYSWEEYLEYNPDAVTYDYEYTFFNKGFIFVDYTAILATMSALGDLIDLPTYLKYYSIETLCQYFKPSKITLIRQIDDTDVVTMTQEIEEWAPVDDTNTYESDFTAVDWSDGAPLYVADFDQAEETDYAETAYSFVTMRNFVPANYSTSGTDEYWSGQYRILGFEFQDIEPAGTDSADGTEIIVDSAALWDDPSLEYALILNYDDTTQIVFGQLHDVFESAYEGLLEYQELAKEDCNYNKIDGRWNQHFKDQMHATYDGSPGAAPWEYYPTLYNIHRDLLEQAFEGDKDKLAAETADIMGRISPDSGNMDHLDKFVEQFTEFWENVWSAVDSELFDVDEDDTGETTSKSWVFTAGSDFSGDFAIGGAGNSIGTMSGNALENWASYVNFSEFAEEVSIASTNVSESDHSILSLQDDPLFIQYWGVADMGLYFADGALGSESSASLIGASSDPESEDMIALRDYITITSPDVEYDWPVDITLEYDTSSAYKPATITITPGAALRATGDTGVPFTLRVDFDGNVKAGSDLTKNLEGMDESFYFED